METTVPSIEALPAATGASPCVVAQAATTISNASGNTAGRRPEARCMGMSCYLVMLSPRLTGQPPREIVEVHAAGRTAPDSRRTSFQLLQQDPPAFDRPVRDQRIAHRLVHHQGRRAFGQSEHVQSARPADARAGPVRPAREAVDAADVEQVAPGALPARPWIDQPCGEALEVVHADAAQHGDEGIAGDGRATGHEVRAWFGVGHVYFKPQSRQLAAIDRLAGHDAALRQFRPGGDAVVMEVALGHYVIAGHGP